LEVQKKGFTTKKKKRFTTTPIERGHEDAKEKQEAGAECREIGGLYLSPGDAIL
jgi:hypothetical protein